MGIRYKQVDWTPERLETLKKLVNKGLAHKTIASIYKVSPDTIRKRIMELQKRGEL